MALLTAPLTLEDLPAALRLRCLAPLPVDARSRCAVLSKAWRDLLAGTAAWTRLDLSPSACVTCRASDDDLLRCAAAKAGGALVSLNVTGLASLRMETLQEVLTANSRTMSELRVKVRAWRRLAASRCATTPLRRALGRGQALVAREEAGSQPEKAGWLMPEDAEAVLAAAPALQTLVASLRCTPQAAAPLLRGEPPFGPLRVTCLKLTDTRKSAVENALATVGRYRHVAAGQRVPPAPVNACIPLLASALRDSRSLAWLECDAMAVLDPPEALATVLASLTGHPTLRVLRLHLLGDTLRDVDDGPTDALRALCALVQADAPSLSMLRLISTRSSHDLHDAELVPLLGDALAHNTHLRVLDCGADSTLSEEAVARVLHAVRAATSLRELHIGDEGEDVVPSMREAQELLRARIKADADAMVA